MAVGLEEDFSEAYSRCVEVMHRCGCSLTSSKLTAQATWRPTWRPLTAAPHSATGMSPRRCGTTAHPPSPRVSQSVFSLLQYFQIPMISNKCPRYQSSEQEVPHRSQLLTQHKAARKLPLFSQRAWLNPSLPQLTNLPPLSFFFYQAAESQWRSILLFPKQSQADRVTAAG